MDRVPEWLAVAAALAAALPLASPAAAQQVADTAYAPPIERPAFPGEERIPMGMNRPEAAQNYRFALNVLGWLVGR